MFRLTQHGAVNIVTGDVPLNSANCEECAESFGPAFTVGRPMAVFDMSSLPLIDSAGLEMLLELQQQFVDSGGELKLAGVNELCQDILKLTGVGERFAICPDVKDAVSSFLV